VTDAPDRPGFLRRLGIAGSNVLTPLHTALIATYTAIRWLGAGDWWLVDALGYILPWLFVPSLVLLPVALFRRRRAWRLLALVPPVLFCLTYGHLFLPRLPIETAGPEFSVLTHNVYYRNEDVDGVAAAIDAHAPDLFVLQELEPEMAAALDNRFASRYPTHRVEPGCGLWSRHPILEYAAYQLVPGEGDWVQQAVVEIDGRRITVLNVHPRSPPIQGIHPLGLPLAIPTGFVTAGRDGDVQGLLSRIARIDGPLIVAGDFNLTDQQSQYRVLTQHLHDAHRESSWGLGFTFTYSPPGSPPLWRIDYAFHSSHLVALSTARGGYGGSDHRPVIARFAFAE